MFEDFGCSIPLALLLLWNAAAFLLMGVDKRRARRGEWRIRERTLLGMAFLLGGPGILAGMAAFRHKTKHWSFLILVPAGILLDFLLIFLIFRAIYGTIII